MKRAVMLFPLLLKEAAHGWSAHRAQKLGAALAFYTTLALAPLTLIAIAIAGYFLGEGAARGEIVHQIEHLVGRDAATGIEAMIQKASEPRNSRIATVLGICLLLIGATNVFAEIKDSLDVIWEVKPKPGLPLRSWLKTYSLSFGIVLATGLLLLLSLLLTALLAEFANWIGHWLPSTVSLAFLIDLPVSFIVATLLFALIFKLLPDVTLRWDDVWIGAILTAVLFLIGKFLIGVYIARAGIGSIYGAAGSLVVVLMWTYYSSQILYFGAEVVRAYSNRGDRHVGPTAQAVPLTSAELARQGTQSARKRKRASGQR
jgi:membrane protein